MKTSTKFVLKSFVGPFIMTFFIALFVLLMQFVWKWIDELIGKGLEWYIIVELMTYVSAGLVPMALPLAILLSSLMTFGNLGERYELVAFKAAGTSLQRVMQPLIITMILISLGAFLFSNYALPVANLKWRSLLYDIRQQKPAINIKPNIFYDEIEGYSIRVEDKQKSERGSRLEKIMIYDHTDRKGNRSVTIADHGFMYTTPDKKYLVLELFKGRSYEDQRDHRSGFNSYPLIRSSFDKNIIRFDLSGFKLQRSKEELFKNNYEMMNISQLSSNIDTLKREHEENIERYRNDLKEKYIYFGGEIPRSNKGNLRMKKGKIFPVKDTTAQQDTIQKKKEEVQKFNKTIIDTSVIFDNYFASLSKKQQKKVFSNSINQVRSHKARSETRAIHEKHKKIFITSHYIEWHRKLTLSMACIILFFIGAPLGAIIRKGGLGMPVVISVIFFIFYYVLSITGEKMTKSHIVDPVFGMWMASIILLPLGVFITYKATTDSPILQMESYTKFFKDLFRRKNDS